MDANDSPAQMWSFNALADTAAGSAAGSTPRVSLFSPSVPPIADEAGSFTSGSSRPPSRVPARAMHAPIVQLHTQIPAAQKSGDDPTTPLESASRKRTTMDLMQHEHATMTSLSRLFSHSRAPSYNNATGPLYRRASNDAIPLPDHLYSRGLLEGRHSDITVLAFGQRYNLHRLILDRAPFFTAALSEPWIESQSKDVTLHPEQIDPSITREAFELAIRKLYGVDISHESDAEAVGLFATGCWLEMQDLVDSAIESILRQMAPDNLAYLIRLVTANYYSRSGDRILESAKAMLSRNGWEMPLRCWDDMPGDIVRELIGSDGFFVDSEWDRWVLAKRILDRRLRQAAIDARLMKRGQKPIPQAPSSIRLTAVRADGVALTASNAASDVHEWLALYTTPDIERILVLLDHGIHYIHMEYEQLDFIRTARDIFGLPVMPERVVSDALWQQLSLRQRVLNADDSAQELGLCQTPEPETPATQTEEIKGKEIEATESNPRRFWIPSSDCNIVLGNGADPVVTTSSSFQRHATRLSATIQPEDAQWAADFASTPATLTNPNMRIDQALRPISAGGSNAGQPKPVSCTEFPPFRFSAEFPNPRFLKEKRRVYSRTVSYAGSLWNVYIQKVRSAKNVQLGVYLHRAKDREGDDVSHASQKNSTSVDEPDMLGNRRHIRRNLIVDQTAEEDASGSGGDPDSNHPDSHRLAGADSNRSGMNSLFSSRRRSTANTFPLATSPPADDTDSPSFPIAMFSPSSSDPDSSDDDSDPYPNPSTSRLRRRQPTLPPYVDARPTIKTYFKIYSPSKGGRMLSIYESAPDRFNFSQSWGWKSSTLMLDEGSVGAGGEDGRDGKVGVRGEGKLRFMIVIGNL